MILKNKDFLKSSVTLISGSMIAQILAVCISPVMTRLYTESQIGEYTLILTAISMFGSVICGRYDMSIVSEKCEEKVYALIKLSFLFTLVLSVVSAVGYSVYYTLFNVISINWLEIFLWIFILLFFTGLGNILLSYNNRYKEYTLMTSVQIVREIGRDIALIGLGLLKFGTIGLIISQIFSVFLGLNKQAKNLKNKLSLIAKCPIVELKKVAKLHIKQLLYSVPASFANGFSYSVLNIFVSNLFGLTTLAYYSMSFRMLGMPLNLLSVNISKVFFEKASREYDNSNNFRKSFIQTTCLMSIIAIPMVIILMLIAPKAFNVFFGQGWEQAGYYVRYLAPMFGIRLIVSGLMPTMIITKKQNLELLIQVLFVVATFVVYVLCKMGSDIENFLILITLSFSLIYIIDYSIMFKLSKGRKIN